MGGGVVWILPTDGNSVCKGIEARKNVSLTEEQYVQ